MYRADMIGIEIDGLPRSMYGEGPAVGGVPSMNGTGVEGQGGNKPAGVSQRQELKETFKNSKEYTVLKKVIRLLQDNRADSGDEETDGKPEQPHADHSESHPVLKTILNVLFISTGLVLLIGVIIVIIYTSIVKEDTDNRSSAHTTTATPTSRHPAAEVIIIDANDHILSHIVEYLSSNENELMPPDHTPQPMSGSSVSHNIGGATTVRPTTAGPALEQATVLVETVRRPNGQEVRAITRCRVHAIVQQDKTVKLGKLCFKMPIEMPRNISHSPLEAVPATEPHPEGVVTTRPSIFRRRRHDKYDVIVT